MHMQQGIGRAGFTLLALVTFAIGAFGFALAWTAFTQGAATFFQMGLGVAADALLHVHPASTSRVGPYEGTGTAQEGPRRRGRGVEWR